MTPADFQAFENTLKVVNAAWSRQDEQGMRSVATPEMMQYFGSDLADLARRGWRNETRDVVLEKGDLAEAWREGAREYATVAMRFSQVDVTRRISDGAVVEGDPNRRVTATELWTFVRTQGGPWMLSAIQQTELNRPGAVGPLLSRFGHIRAVRAPGPGGAVAIVVNWGQMMA